MRKKPTWLIVSAVAIALVLFALVQRQGQPTKSSLATASPQPTAQAAKSGPLSSIVTHIPAHYESAPPSNKLAATLAPERFSGKAREAYQAVRDTTVNRADTLLLPLRSELRPQESAQLF